MKIGLIIHTLAGLMFFIGLSMLIPFLIALGYGEGDAEARYA